MAIELRTCEVCQLEVSASTLHDGLCPECREAYPELDLYEGRHRAEQDREERRYLIYGPSAEERFNTGAGWYP